MLNLQRIESLVKSHSVQEMVAAMIWQRRFNQFDGREVVEDLIQYENLWLSFFFGRPIYLDDKNRGLGFFGLIETLMVMANYKPDENTVLPQDFVYPGDTLFLLTRNIDTTVSQLLDLGKKWRADDICIYDGHNEGFSSELQEKLMVKLTNRLWPDLEETGNRDAVLITFWWD